MTLRELLKDWGRTRGDWLDKEIVIEAPNGMFFEPKLRAIPEDGISLITSKGQIEKLVVSSQ